MEKVLGIGGFFFRSKDPSELAQWYEDNLGISLVPKDYGTPSWRQSGGSTVFAPFEEATDYFGRPEQQWMINFRVRDLDAMCAQLEKVGVKIEDEGDFENGRFAKIADPEGNPIQLWQPVGLALEVEETD